MLQKKLVPPPAVLFLVWWCVITFVVITVLTWIGLVFFPAPDSMFASAPISYYIFSIFVAPVLGVLCAAYAGIAGALHSLLRNILLRTLASSDELESINVLRYRLINLGYGLVCGLVFGAFGIFVAEGNELLLFVAGSALLCGLVGFGVGEVVRSKFDTTVQNVPAAVENASKSIVSPPEPYPVRQRSPEEDALLDDADEVLARLSSEEAKRRWRTLYALGQLAEPEEHVLGAVTTLATYDPVAYVREAARSVLAVWKSPVPDAQPDTDAEITASRVRGFSIPNVALQGIGADWEHVDFVYRWQHKAWKGSTLLSQDEVRESVWQAYKAQISAELKKWQTQGWVLDEPIGPNAIQLTTYRELNLITVLLGGFLLLIIFGILAAIGRGNTGNIGGLGDGPDLYNFFHEPSEIRQPMHRSKVHQPTMHSA